MKNLPFDFGVIRHGSPEYEATVRLRDEILRKPLGLVFSPEQLAAEHTDLHLAVYDDNVLLGCLILSPRQSGAVQMRQVAIRGDRQGQGIGGELVAYSEKIAREKGFDKMILHARETAVSFYERLDYKKEGQPFIEVGLKHFKMYKFLR